MAEATVRVRVSRLIIIIIGCPVAHIKKNPPNLTEHFGDSRSNAFEWFHHREICSNCCGTVFFFYYR